MEQKLELKFKKLVEDAVMPSYANEGDAGIDLTTIGFTQDFDDSGKLVLAYRTGLSVEIPEGHVGFLFMRSSISKKSLALTNAVGVIDSGYRGEIIGKFKVTTDALPSIYKSGERFAQLVVMPYPKFDITMSEELAEGDRGENGFGSTGDANVEKVSDMPSEPVVEEVVKGEPIKQAA